MIETGTILIVDDTPANLDVLVHLMRGTGFKILVARDGLSAIKQIEHTLPDVILLDVVMPGIDGFETCRRLKANAASADIPVIFMTSLNDPGNKLKGFELGAVDYVTKPFQHEVVVARVTTHLKLRRLQKELEQTNQSLEKRVAERTSELESLRQQLEKENVYLQEEIKDHYNFESVIGNSDGIRNVFDKVNQVAEFDASVLIGGETGTGKELIARAIHEKSKRSKRPLIKVNCASLAENLVESDLFGHEKGAFTSAYSQKPGRFEVADGGTLFLDEIGELPLELQPKLLGVLQDGKFERVGGTKTIKVDVRIVAATHRDLPGMISEHLFREDLYYRLNLYPISLPPLRDRKDDIPALAKHFLQKYGAKYGKRVTKISKGVINTLKDYAWPGNIRELENLIARSLITSPSSELVLAEWPLRGAANTQPLPDTGLLKLAKTSGAEEFPTLKAMSKAHILNALRLANGKVSGNRSAAELLGIHPNTLVSKMKRLGIDRGSGE